MSTASTGVAATRSGKAPGTRKPAPRKRRTQAERSDETRTRVIEAAAEVLRRKGYAGLRTDEVSRVARVSRGAQQYHFPSKDSLVLATAAYLMRTGLERGRSRAASAGNQADVIEALIQDCLDFFMGRDFNVALDLVLSGSKDKGLREKIYVYTRESRLGVEDAWIEVLCERGIPRDKAEMALWLTTSIVRGLAVRALWQNDDKLFRRVLDEWKLILGEHLRQQLTGVKI